jgi:cytochrome c551/c552
MDFYKIIAKKIVLPGLLFLLSFQLQAQTGQQLFVQNCQQCHALDKVLSGPALRGVTERGPWGDRKNLYDWVHNPAGFMAKDASGYTPALKAQFGTIMTPFPNLTNEQIDAIIDYVMAPPSATGSANGTQTDDQGPNKENTGAITFGVISVILAIIALILMQVNSNLKKLSDDKENIQRPDPVPFWRNKIYIALLALIFFVVGGFYIAKGAIGLGRQQGYQPTQPIYFSHKVHAGINQINCQYCHSAVTESRHATIPSLNVCMNCHKVVTSYDKGPQLYDGEKKIDGTAEIEKLLDYAGFKPGPGAQWDPSKAKPIEWVKIHNLPDHVYFNHAQHVKVGQVACQSCHGNIQEMDKVHQESELSMGWCINCHRETKVNFYNKKDSSGNKFYSIYEKFYNDMAEGKMDSVTVKDIGGLECQKCHY